jgi:oligopeptide transport system substrate-binding protein
LISHLFSAGQLPTDSLVPKSLLPSQQPQSLKTPSQLLQEALQEVGIKKEEIPSLKLFYVSQECNHLIAQAMQREWKESLGITIELQAVEAKTFYHAITAQEYQLAISSWFADFQDPINFLELFKYKDGKCNHTSWQNEEYIRLLDRSEEEIDGKTRMDLLQQANGLLMKEMPIIPVYQASLCYLKKDKVKGVYVSPLGYVDFKWVEVE